MILRVGAKNEKETNRKNRKNLNIPYLQWIFMGKKIKIKNDITEWIKLILKMVFFPVKWVHNKVVQYNQVINAYVTMALVLVSVLLVIVTINSANISKQLGEIETYLAADKAKQEILAQKTLAENLLLETIKNKQEFIDYIVGLERGKNTTEYRMDYLNILRIQQARDMISFGSPSIRLKLDNYLEAVNSIKDDLEQIRLEASTNQYKVKKERIDRAIAISKSLIDGSYRNVKIDEFIKDIQDYIKDRDKAYNEIDKQMKESLLKLFSNDK